MPVFFEHNSFCFTSTTSHDRFREYLGRYSTFEYGQCIRNVVFRMMVNYPDPGNMAVGCIRAATMYSNLRNLTLDFVEYASSDFSREYRNMTEVDRREWAEKLRRRISLLKPNCHHVEVSGMNRGNGHELILDSLKVMLL
jgi:hypothetical protein